MGCASSAHAYPNLDRIDSKQDSTTREAGSTPVFDKDTTASGKYSTRRSLTVWDLKAERDRQSRLSLRQTPSPLSEHSFRRTTSASDRMFVVPVQESRMSAKHSTHGGSLVSPRPRQTTIPPWHANHRKVSNASYYAGSVIGNSPSSRSVHAHRSGLYGGGQNSPTSVSSSYNHQPVSPFSHTSQRIQASSNLRASKSFHNFSDMSPRYGERSTPQMYPSRRVR